MSVTYGLIIGFLGGLAPEVYAIWELRYSARNRRPAWLRSWFYYAASLAMAAVGAFLVWLYMSSGTEMPPILAAHIGASAPLALRRLGEHLPGVEPGKAIG